MELTQSGIFLPSPKVTDTSRERTRKLHEGPKRTWSPAEHLIDNMKKLGILFAGLTDTVEVKVANHATGKTTWTVTAPTFLALCSVAITDTDTSASITDLTYTGYARLSFAATDFNTAGTSGGVTTTTAPVAGKTFGAVTAGSGTAISWGRCSVVSGAGDVIIYGSLTSVTFSTTQTPPTVAAGSLVEGWD